MKKVLAIVLAMAMMLSFVPLMVSALDITDGQMIFGVKEDIEANPGETVDFVIQFKALPNPEDIVEGITDDGMVYIPFLFAVADEDMSLLEGVKLIDGAKNEGCTLFLNEDECDASKVMGYASVPSKYLFNKEAIDVLKLTVKVSENWVVENYKEKSPVTINIYSGDEAGATFFVPKDAEAVENPYEYGAEYFVFGILGVTGNITARPYQPKFFEKVWEWIKDKIRFLIELDNTIDNLLLTKVFNPADWYNDYMLRKQAGKA